MAQSVQIRGNVIDTIGNRYKQELRRIRSLRTQVVLWLIVVALGVVIIPILLITGWVRNDVARLETELLTVQSMLEKATTPNEETIKLSADVARIDQLASTIQTITIPSGVNWPQVVDAAAQYDPSTIQIASLTQANNMIQITGRASSNDAVVAYQQILLNSLIFKDVLVVSMAAVPPTPVPTAAATDEASADGTESATGASARDASMEAVELPFGNVDFVINLIVEAPIP